MTIQELDIHLNIKVVTPTILIFSGMTQLDIHLNIKVVTPYEEKSNDSQLYITKIK